MTSLVVRLASFAILAALIAPDAVAPRARAQTIATERGVPGSPIEARWRDDLAAMASFRPGYAFWQHIFRIPDGSIAYGSAIDGRLLALFPAKGDWTSGRVWIDRSLAGTLDDVDLPRSLDERRDEVARLIENVAGPVAHNPTRGGFLLPNARRYGRFLDEWRAIYERFGVPADLGLAQAILESGLNGTRRSEANAVGLCQWLRGNWARLDRLSPVVLEGHNQTTQAPYCAAYLSVLATKYGSFIPALSEHNAGGTNVGRTLINGERLGGRDVRSRYFLGSKLAHDLRALALDEYRDLYRTYGLRSYLYAEMVFGNTFTVKRLAESTRQARIYAMRTRRAIALSDVARRTRLSVDEIRRYNPALVRRVPANATLYLPSYVRDFGADVSFWHRPAPAAYAAVLDAFLGLDVTPGEWDDPSFEAVLRGFQRRFRDTRTEEGTIMSTVLAYAIDETYASGRRELLAEFESSDDVSRLLERGLTELEVERDAPAVSLRE
jgi:hypothetical protein